jgi:uncharacterized DUF497 family protein
MSGKKKGGAAARAPKAKAKAQRKTQSNQRRRAAKKSAKKEQASGLLRQCVAYCLKHGLKGKSGIKEISARDFKKFETVPKATLSANLGRARDRIQDAGVDVADLVGASADATALDLYVKSSAVEDRKIMTPAEMTSLIDWQGLVREEVHSLQEMRILWHDFYPPVRQGRLQEEASSADCEGGTRTCCCPAPGCIPISCIVCCPSPRRHGHGRHRHRAGNGRRRAASAGRGARHRAALSAVWGAGLIVQLMRSCAPRPCQAV